MSGANHRLVLPAILWMAFGSGCSATMHAHRTLEGQAFRIQNVGMIRQGLTAEQVVDLLGEPLERNACGKSSRWRYFERAFPRRCDGGKNRQARPEYRIEVLLEFDDGIVQQSQVQADGALEMAVDGTTADGRMP